MKGWIIKKALKKVNKEIEKARKGTEKQLIEANIKAVKTLKLLMQDVEITKDNGEEYTEKEIEEMSIKEKQELINGAIKLTRGKKYGN